MAATVDVPAGAGESRRLVQLCAAGTLAYCSYAMCRSPLLPLFARELGADARMTGLVVAASTITGVFLKLPAGAWSDVVGRRVLLVAGAAVFAVLPFTYILVSGIALLMVLRVVHGSATAIFGPVASASLSDVAPPFRRATWLSTYATCQGVGQAIAPVVAGAFIAAGRFDMVFVVAGLIGLATPWIVLTWPARPSHAAGSHAPLTRHVATGLREVLAERRILVASVTQAAYFVVNGTLNAFLPLFARDVVGLDAAGIGWLFGAQTVTTLAVRPVIGMASDRAGRRGAIVAGMLLCSAAVLAIASASGAPVLIAGVLTYALGAALTTAAAGAYITDVAPKARFGAAHGVFGTVYDVGDAGGPLIGGLLVAAWGYGATFNAMAVLAAIAAVGFAWLSRSTRRAGPVVVTGACVVASLSMGCGERISGQSNAPSLRAVATIPLPDVAGRIDHLAFDPDTQRLFVAALGNDTVEVVDTVKLSHLRSQAGFHTPQGLAIVPEAHAVAVSNGDTGTLQLLDVQTLQTRWTADIGGDADNVRYDAVARRLYVAAEGGLFAVDPATGRSSGRIAISGHPESFQLESQGSRVYANLPGSLGGALGGTQVVAADRTTMTATARWPACGANYPMALDEAGRRLFVGCRRPASVALLDTASGKTVSTTPTVGDTDDLFYDAEKRRLYVIGGAGAIDVFAREADTLRRIDRIQTRDGARTGLWVAGQRRLYVAVPRRGGAMAEIRVFEAP